MTFGIQFLYEYVHVYPVASIHWEHQDFAPRCTGELTQKSLDRLNCAVAFRPDFPSASGLVV
ncbi:hypothetical protein INR49_027130 [Caranx melampygus]|nr:hypothetical protein INR49_027130 [Caranx melampygus]